MFRTQQRKAFSMMMAIFVILIMSFISVLVFNLSSKMGKETVQQFQEEQAALLASSYTEYAIMAVMANDHNSTNCLNNIQGSYGPYDVNVKISYIGRPSELSGGNCTFKYPTIQEDNIKASLNIIVDVFVRYDVLDHPAATPPKKTYHKRTLQKI